MACPGEVPGLIPDPAAVGLPIFAGERMMKRVVLLASLMLIPAGLFLAAWQAFSYYQLHLEVQALEREQQALIDDNRRLVAEFAFASSPGTVEKRAARELGMVWPGQDQLITLRVKSGGGQP